MENRRTFLDLHFRPEKSQGENFVTFFFRNTRSNSPSQAYPIKILWYFCRSCHRHIIYAFSLSPNSLDFTSHYNFHFFTNFVLTTRKTPRKLLLFKKSHVKWKYSKNWVIKKNSCSFLCFLGPTIQKLETFITSHIRKFSWCDNIAA